MSADTGDSGAGRPVSAGDAGTVDEATACDGGRLRLPYSEAPGAGFNG